MSSNRNHLLQKLVWDYSYSLEDLNKVLNGELSHVGHLNKRALFIRAVESLSWYSVLELFEAKEVLLYLNEGAISEIRSKSLKKRYEFTKTRLHQIISTAG